MKLVLLHLFLIITVTNCSKCPEGKKPHPTSCTIFYSCVNLPSGGYVWVPTKCSDGLMFEPYLRICVLPGDSWSCDAPSTELSLVTRRYETPELINPNETSYVGVTEDFLDFSEPIDSSYTTDNILDSLNHETVTPYPIIEIEDDTKNKQEKDTVNIEKAQYDLEGKKSALDKLISHLLVYKEITIPLEYFVSPSVSAKPDTSTFESVRPTTTSMKSDQHKVLMNYLIHNYIRQNNLQNIPLIYTKLQDASKTNESEANSSGLNALDVPINDQDVQNYIVLINNNVGEKQYLTIEKYKSVAHRLNSELARLVPCVRNVRLPNSTDCNRYYTCEPDTALVTEYACPLRTAFNKYTRICDTESRDACIQSKLTAHVTGDMKYENVSDEVDIKAQMKKLCPEFGKIKDPTSDSHYYICYAAAGTTTDIKSIRMSCPNDLIFCQSKKVCTTRRLCKTT